jgi:hypothetical protein
MVSIVINNQCFNVQLQFHVVLYGYYMCLQNHVMVFFIFHCVYWWVLYMFVTFSFYFLTSLTFILLEFFCVPCFSNIHCVYQLILCVFVVIFPFIPLYPWFFLIWFFNFYFYLNCQSNVLNHLLCLECYSLACPIWCSTSCCKVLFEDCSLTIFFSISFASGRLDQSHLWKSWNSQNIFWKIWCMFFLQRVLNNLIFHLFQFRYIYKVLRS